MELSATANWETELTELFLLRPEDVTPAYVDWLADPDVSRYLESRFGTHTEQSTRAYVSACMNDPNTLFLGIRCKAMESAHVGNVKLAPIDRHHGLAEVGIMIGDRGAWGRGIATDVLKSVIRISQDELALRKLTAGCYGSNVGSRKAFERAGFQVEADGFLLRQ